MIINPQEITNFNRSERELQVFAIFAVCVAGKNADQTAEKVTQLLADCPPDQLPLDHLCEGTRLHNKLVAHRVGQYHRLVKAIQGLHALDLSSCSVDDLVAIHGISYKTATFFLLHSRRDMDLVVLDTHVLNWLRKRGCEGVPKSSPREPKVYEKWSKLAAKLYRSVFGDSLSLADIDLMVWRMMRGDDDGLAAA